MWFNPNLPELYSLPDQQRWSTKGVKYLCHLFTAQGFKSFYQFRVDFSLPCTYIFYYYQLCHAVRTQFGSLDNPIQVPLEKLLGHSDPTKLICAYYSALCPHILIVGVYLQLQAPTRNTCWQEKYRGRGRVSFMSQCIPLVSISIEHCNKKEMRFLL